MEMTGFVFKKVTPRIACFLLLFLTGTHLYAQPTLVASNCSPTGYEAFARHMCGVSSFTPGAAGTGVTWNFAGLSTIATDTIDYANCSGSAMCDSFAGSALYSINAGSSQFYASDTNTFSLIGSGIAGGNLYYSDPKALIFYPATYNSIAVDTYVCARAGYLGFGRDSFTVDGYGTLIVPGGSYSNTLRLHTICINIDSSISGSAISVDTFRTDVYYWYTPGVHSPLLAMYYDFGTLTGPPELAQIIYYKPVTDVLNAGKVAETDLQIFPNPATDQITISGRALAGQTVSLDLFDVSGRAVLEETKQMPTSDENIVLNLPPVAQGVYILRISCAGKIVYKKVSTMK